MSDEGLAIAALEGHDDRIRAEVTLGAGERWFAGHFPGAPVLPAIAHFDLVCRVHRAAGGSGLITLLDRVRLVAPVRPGDRLEIMLERKQIDTWKFTLRGTDGQIVSDGMVRWAAVEEAPE